MAAENVFALLLDARLVGPSNLGRQRGLGPTSSCGTGEPCGPELAPHTSFLPAPGALSHPLLDGAGSEEPAPGVCGRPEFEPRLPFPGGPADKRLTCPRKPPLSVVCGSGLLRPWS